MMSFSPGKPEDEGDTVTYKTKELARMLGLKRTDSAASRR